MIHRMRIIACLLAWTGIFCAENDKIFIREMTLIGNKHVSEKEVLFIVRQRPPNFFFRRQEFDSRLLKLDALTLENYYKSKGFLEARVKESYTIQDIYADLVFTIIEGKQYFLSEVQISGNSLIDNSNISEILELKLGDPYNPVAINENLFLLENEYHNLGKLFFSVNIQDNISDSVSVKIDIQEGKDVFIKNTYFEKIGIIDSSIVWRELTYKTGDRYSKTEIDRTSRRIREMGIFSMVNFIPVKVSDSDSLVNMVIEFRKYKQREWNSTGGYDPINFAEGTPDLPALSGTIKWTNRAIFNTPKRFSTKLMAGIPVETDFITPRLRYDASLSTNWLLGIRVPSKLTGYYERFIEYDGQTYEGSIDRFGTNLTQQIKLNGRSYFENKVIWENFSDTSDVNIEERSILMRIYLDQKDDPLFTKNGYLVDIIIKSTGFGGSRDYNKADMTLQSYFAITDNTIYAMRFQLGRLWGWNELDTDHSYEKFYLGGSTSMRAWDVLMFKTSEKDEPLGGIYRLMTNIETRQHIYKSVGAILFVDGGLLSDFLREVNFKKFQWDAGLGLSFKTPLGPIRLDYAFQTDKPNNYKVQLGVQYLF